jgi:hypothetical protein
MPLNEDEQRILEQIERQFYEEDPDLAHSVANASLRSRLRPHRRLAILGFIVGLVVMVVSLKILWVATLGFILMLASAGWLAMTFRRGSQSGSDGIGKWLERARQKWPRNG